MSLWTAGLRFMRNRINYVVYDGRIPVRNGFGERVDHPETAEVGCKRRYSDV